VTVPSISIASSLAKRASLRVLKVLEDSFNRGLNYLLRELGESDRAADVPTDAPNSLFFTTELKTDSTVFVVCGWI
jgi:hypothetical protein